MKLILAIVNNDDKNFVRKALIENGFTVTVLSTTGGILKAGNTTFILGTSDEQVPIALDIIKSHSKKRVQPISASSMVFPSALSGLPAEVSVGGAAVFVLNIERFEKF